MKKLLFLVLCVFFSAMESAFAVDIVWMQVQHREYGNGKTFNQLGFGLTDAYGNYLKDGKRIRSVKLYNPAKKELTLSGLKFASDKEIYGTYNAKNSQWHYGMNWLFESWFAAEISDVLTPGVYWLKVTMTDGKTAEQTFVFNTLVDLPVIDVGSFELNPDAHGNLIWTWKIPLELGQLSLTHKLRARVAMDIFSAGKDVGYFSIIVPVHLGFVLVPQKVLRLINRKGDRFELTVSIETRDKNNRTYSKALVIEKKLPSVPIK